jgi:hypothetical protein
VLGFIEPSQPESGAAVPSGERSCPR